MLATFAIEMVMAAYAIWRYKLDVLQRLVVASLLALAVFQISEYFVCGGWGMAAGAWSKVGYVAITTLPALGLHMLHQLAGKKNRRLVLAAYTTMAGFMAYFLAYEHAFRGHVCEGNYVIFQLGMYPAWVYSSYYYGWLFTAIGLGVRWANELQALKNKAARVQLQSVRALIVGYLVFLVPTALANTFIPETRAGIPSIMCGFAVLFAFILTFYILPKNSTLRPRSAKA